MNIISFKNLLIILITKIYYKCSISVDIERFIFPAKITDSEITTFIIPIQPRWAAYLFDEHLGNQMLALPGFGSKPELAFNREAVYYILVLVLM